MGSFTFNGRINAYKKRHAGRDPFNDALVGLLSAAPAALERWLHEHVIPASRLALKGQMVERLPSLPSWLKGIILVHLSSHRSELEPGSGYELWTNDRLMLSLLQDEPLSWFVETLNAHARLGKWHGGEDVASLGSIKDSILKGSLKLSRSALPHAPAPDSMAYQLLDYCRSSIVGMGAVKKESSPFPINVDRVTRRFVVGIETLFESEKLGSPSAADLAVISLVSGYECDAPKAVHERWKKRRKRRGDERDDKKVRMSPVT